MFRSTSTENSSGLASNSRLFPEPCTETRVDKWHEGVGTDFPNHELEEKYRRLGFQCEGFGMHLRIGEVDIKAVEHPYKGVALFLSCYTPRTLCQFETSAPVCASVEQIACLIYAASVLTFPPKPGELR